MKLKTTSLSEESLKEVGYLLTPAGAPSRAKGEDFAYADTNLDLGLRQPLSSGALECAPRPATLTRMERHLRSREMLVALTGDSIICVAPPQEPKEGRLSSVRALAVKAGQSFVMEKGAWHWIPFPTGKQATRFLVLFTANTGRDDIEFADLSTPYSIE